MAFWRGDEHQRAMRPAQQTAKRHWVVTVPPPFQKPTEEVQMAEVTPEKSDAPLGTETVAQVAAATKADVGEATTEVKAAESKVKAFFAKHKEKFAILGAVAIVLALLHFVL